MQATRGNRAAQMSYEDDQLEPEVTMEIGFAKIIVVDNVPVVPQEKYDKLKGVITKIYSSIGTIRDLYMPQDENSSTKGFAFVEFTTVEAAETAIAKTNGYKLDKSHIFRVSSYDDFNKYMNVKDEYIEPEPKPYEPRDNMKSWMLTEEAVDQFCIRYGDVTEILWNDLKAGHEPKSVEKRVQWTETYAAWSPLGSYLLTIYSNHGVAIWGGPKWEKLMRFPHPGVKLIDFSPCEKYLVTASPQFAENDNPKDPQCIIVWDVRTGEKLRGFLGGNTSVWPVFKWSHDDKFLARLGDEVISVYETPSMNLLDKKSLKATGIKDFSWSPSQNIISYFVPEANNKPASVVLLEIPSKKEIRQKNLFSVADCKMHWHTSGAFLAVKVDRTSKSKKSTFTDFILLRMREKDIPIEQIEIKESVQAFAWEPKGTRFAVIHGEGARPSVSFYEMSKQVKLLKTVEKKAANHLFWSPQGSFIVLAGLHALNGALEFFNVDDMETMGAEEHFMATSVDWDPSGRYVATVVSHWRHQLENGYNIYSFQGKLLKHVLKDKFYQLLWRPRPASLLSEERQLSIKNNIHKWEKKFEEIDKAIKEKEREEIRKLREVKRKEFETYLKQKEEEWIRQKSQRMALCGGADPDEDNNATYTEQWVEELQDYQEIPIQETD